MKAGMSMYELPPPHIIFANEQQPALVAHAFDRGEQPPVVLASNNALAPIQLTAAQQRAISAELEKAINHFGPAPFESVFTCGSQACTENRQGIAFTPKIRDHWKAVFNHVNKTLPGATEYENLFLLMAVNYDNNLLDDPKLSEANLGGLLFAFRPFTNGMCRFRQNDLLKLFDFHNKKYKNHPTIPTFLTEEREDAMLDLMDALEKAPGYNPKSNN